MSPRLPTGFTWQRALEFAEAISMDMKREDVARMFGVTKKTVFNWQKSEWFQLAKAENSRGGLHNVLAKSRLRLEELVESENEGVALSAVKFALERLDPEFAPASAKAKDDKQNEGSNLSSLSDTEIKRVRNALRAASGDVEDSVNSALHGDFQFSFAPASPGSGETT